MRRYADFIARTIISYYNKGVSSSKQVNYEKTSVDVDNLLRDKPASVDDMLYVKQQLSYVDRLAQHGDEGLQDFVDRALYSLLEELSCDVKQKHKHREAHISLLMSVFHKLVEFDKSVLKHATALITFRSKGESKQYLKFKEEIKQSSLDFKDALKTVFTSLYHLNHQGKSQTVKFDGQEKELETTLVYRFGVSTGASGIGQCFREELLRPLKLSGDMTDSDIAVTLNGILDPDFASLDRRLELQEQVLWAQYCQSLESGTEVDSEEAWQKQLEESRREIATQKALLRRVSQQKSVKPEEPLEGSRNFTFW